MRNPMQIGKDVLFIVMESEFKYLPWAQIQEQEQWEKTHMIFFFFEICIHNFTTS